MIKQIQTKIPVVHHIAADNTKFLESRNSQHRWPSERLSPRSVASPLQAYVVVVCGWNRHSSTELHCCKLRGQWRMRCEKRSPIPQFCELEEVLRGKWTLQWLQCMRKATSVWVRKRPRLRGGVAIAFGRYFDQKTKNLKDPYSNLTFCENHPNGQNTETACVLRVPEITKQRVHPWIFDQNQ